MRHEKPSKEGFPKSFRIRGINFSRTPLNLWRSANVDPAENGRHDSWPEFPLDQARYPFCKKSKEKHKIVKFEGIFT